MELATSNTDLGMIFTIIGGMLTLGIVATQLSRRLPVPHVTVLVTFGLLLGPHTFGIIPLQSLDWFPLVADMTLVLIGFLLGEHMTLRHLRKYGRTVIIASLAETTITLFTVTTVCIVAGLPVHLAVLLGAIAPATAPAATMAVIEESKITGRFSETLLEVVAIDDAWGILLFSLALAFVGSVEGNHFEFSEILAGIQEIGTSLAIGAVFGFPLALLTSRTGDETLTLAETMGMAFLAAGVALLFDVSYLLAAVSMGIVVANFSQHKDQPFHAIHSIIFPFTSVFFVLAGASFDPSALGGFGFAGIVYIVSRAAGKLLGGTIGARLGGFPTQQARWFGAALLPQAGVALGMALIAADRYPAYRQQIVGIVVGATMIFELLGPVATKTALRRTVQTKPI